MNAPTATKEQFISGYVIDGTVYLNADHVALAAHKVGLPVFAENISQAATEIRRQAK